MEIVLVIGLIWWAFNDIGNAIAKKREKKNAEEEGYTVEFY